MTAELPEGLVTEGVRSLEVRWIFPGNEWRQTLPSRRPCWPTQSTDSDRVMDLRGRLLEEDA